MNKKRAAGLYDAALFKEHTPEECPICMLPLPLYDNHTGTNFHTCWQHRKACKKRAAELYDEKMFKEPSPPREECPICMLSLPLCCGNHTGTTFFSCCGKNICIGCIDVMVESGAKDLCPFCRTPYPSSDEEEVKRLHKLMKNGNADAFLRLAGLYAQGIRGMPQDWARCNELFLKGGELGCAAAYYNLGKLYNDGIGVQVDTKKAKHYYELAAMNGSVQARHSKHITRTPKESR